MNFSSLIFLLVFFPIVLFAYFVADQFKNSIAKNIVFLLFSCFFYAWAGVKFFLFILALASFNYLFGLFIGIRKAKKAFLACAISLDLLFLAFFKYLNFALSLLSIQNDFVSSIVAPLGVSFIVFHLITYVVDIYRDEKLFDKNYLNFLVYVFFFPKVIAGPICPYNKMAQAIQERHTSLDMWVSGFKRFCFGLAEKVFISDIISTATTIIFANVGELSTGFSWLGIFSYSIQLYIDFVSYSNMAIGLGLIFGFFLPENFNYPYIAISIQDFWRRWHISLSTWFRNYLYIPLGGNRKGKVRTYFNLFFVFLMTGIWHGASLQFLVWGLFHGVFIVIERMGLSKLLKKIPRPFSWAYAMIVVLFGWIFFNCSSLGDAFTFIGKMFVFNNNNALNASLLPKLNVFFYIALGVGTLLSFPILPLCWNKFQSKVKVNENVVFALSCLFACLCLFASIAYISGNSYNPFIYFNF